MATEVCEPVRLVCQRIMDRSLDPEVDADCEFAIARLTYGHEVATPLGRLLRELRRDLDGDIVHPRASAPERDEPEDRKAA